MNYVVSFQGGETSGSVAKRNLNSTFRRQNIVEQAPDKLSFKGKSEDNASSFGKGFIMTLATAALIVGGLGYAHKADVVGKLKDGKVKDFTKQEIEMVDEDVNIDIDIQANSYQEISDYNVDIKQLEDDKNSSTGNL